MKIVDPKIADLRRIPGLEDRSDRELAQLCPFAERVIVRAGRVLTRQGAPARQAFLVLEGEAAAHQRGALPQPVAVSEWVGDVATRLAQPYDATVVAESSMRLLVFNPRTLVTITEAIARPRHRAIAGGRAVDMAVRWMAAGRP